MKMRLIAISLLMLLSIILWFFQLEYSNAYLTKAFYTILSLLIIYVVIKIIFDQLIAKRIQEAKTRYSMKRIASMLSVLTFIAAGITIWVDNLQALLVSYGILAAGAAVCLRASVHLSL